jgi:broad specificity phosphatase PhoE
MDLQSAAAAAGPERHQLNRTEPHNTRPHHTRPSPTRLQPKRLLLWRHGQTDWNVADRAQGTADIPLNRTGREQAAAAAPVLAAMRPDGIWSSNLSRARDTARAVARLTGQRIALDPRLREIGVGIRQGLTRDELRRQHPEVHRRFTSDEGYVVPGAEHPDCAGTRMAAALNDVAAALEEGGTALVVGHGAAIRRGIIAMLGLPGHLQGNVPAPSNCAWHVLEHHSGGQWVLATPRGMAASNVADDAGYFSSATPDSMASDSAAPDSYPSEGASSDLFLM